MMGNENLVYKFSNELYATRAEVSQYLGISNIDVIWSSITNYRSTYTIGLSIRNVERMPYNIVLTPKILDHLTTIERRLSKIMVKYGKLNDNDYVKYSVRTNQYHAILSSIAHKYHLDFSDGLLNIIMEGTTSALTPNQNVLLNYYRALNHIENHFYDIVALLEYFDVNKLNNGLYRLEEIDDREAHFVINRIYTSAPVERIEPMMNDLLAFINDSNLSPLTKAIVTYFYINIIKPFDYYSEEMSILFMKLVLAHNDFDEIGVLLNFECLIDEFQEDINFICKEVNKTNDITYLLVKVLELMDDKITDISNFLLTSNAQSIEKEFFKTEKEEEKSKEIIEKKPEVVENSAELLHNVDYEVRVALPKLPIGLDERDAMRIAEHLLEMNPTLKRGEALFYARHCTIGKYYTIQQYKVMNDCAYETARTSMDHLVSEGFYRKEMIKNKKFVYTPIPRK